MILYSHHSTCITFKDTDNWREELQLMACDDCQSSKRVELELEDELEDEKEQSITKSINKALTTVHDLFQFTTQHQNYGKYISEYIFKAVTKL